MKKVLWIAVVLATGVYICTPVQDPDLWWHITVGKWILAHGEIPMQDQWNLFSGETVWRAYSWSNEVLFAFVDGRFGLDGLLVLKLLSCLLLAFSLFYCLGRIANDFFLGSILGVFSTVSCFAHLTLRPQTLVWVFFIWMILVADRVVREKLSWQTFIMLVLLGSLWANTHLSAILGLAVVGAWIFDRDRILTAILAVLACLLGTFLTPYFGGEWLTFFEKSAHPFDYNVLREFRPATILQHTTAFLLVGLVLLAALSYRAPRRLGDFRLLGCFAFILGALAVVKFMPFAIIFVVALIALTWRQAKENGDTQDNLTQAIEKLRALLERIPAFGVAFVVVCIAVVQGGKLFSGRIPHQVVVPKEALDFFEAKDLPHPVLNDFGAGGYLIYRFSDQNGVARHKVPIDGRTNVVPRDIWNEYRASFTGKLNWRDFVDRVNPNTIIWRAESPLNAILFNSPSWCLVRKDENKKVGYNVFLRRDQWESRSASLPALNCKAEPKADSQLPAT